MRFLSMGSSSLSRLIGNAGDKTSILAFRWRRAQDVLRPTEEVLDQVQAVASRLP